MFSITTTNCSNFPCLHNSTIYNQKNIVQINALYIATSPDTTSIENQPGVIDATCIENQPGVVEEQERAPTEEGKREHCHTTVKNV